MHVSNDKDVTTDDTTNNRPAAAKDNQAQNISSQTRLKNCFALITAFAFFVVMTGFIVRPLQVFPDTKHHSSTAYKMSSSNIQSTSFTDNVMAPLKQLKIVSMNVAGCAPSADAPSFWDRDIATMAIREELLKSNPDILLLQECPGGIQWGNNIFSESDFQVMGVRAAHADNVVVLLKSEIAAKAMTVNVPRHVPAVMVQVGELCIASVHLAPFKDNDFLRKKQVQELIDVASSSCSILVIGGDTNMRQAEDSVMETGLKLLDAWKLAGSQLQTKFTWDTKDNGNSFNRYYGSDTRQYNARYDRLYIHSPYMDVTVPKFELIANKPIPPSKTHFLSDHFGMSIVVDIDWNTKKN